MSIEFPHGRDNPPGLGIGDSGFPLRCNMLLAANGLRVSTWCATGDAYQGREECLRRHNRRLPHTPAPAFDRYELLRVT